jgi:hypothetical protein
MASRILVQGTKIETTIGEYFFAGFCINQGALDVLSAMDHFERLEIWTSSQ